MGTWTTTPSTATAGAAITSATWNSDVRDLGNAFGAWTSWTPTLAQGASSNITKTVNYAKYTQVGKTVYGQVYLTSTAAGTAGSQVTITLPVTAAQTGMYVGSGLYNDGGTSYPAVANLASTTTLRLVRADAIPTGGVGADPNIAVASGDVFYASFIYEAA